MVATSKSQGPAGYMAGENFTHKGKSYSLFRREGQVNFYLRVSLRGEHGARERRTKCLGTADPKTAMKNARLWLDAVDSGDWGRVDELRAKSAFCTIGEMVEIYEARAEKVLRITHKTRMINAGAFLGLVAEGLGISRAAARARRAECLTGDLVRRFVVAAREAGLQDAGIASRLRKARAVVSPLAVEMVMGGLKVPDLAGFRGQPVSLDPARDLGFRPFPEAVRVRLEQTMAGLRDVLPGVYLTYLAMARLGLRNCEVWPMRWDWFREAAGGQVVLEIRDRPEEGFATKTGEARDLLVPPGLWRELLAVRGEDERDYFLPAVTMTERRKIVERDINQVLRPILAGYRAGAYELRRWAGSLVWTTQGPAAAQRFLGHTSVRTTEKYYARFLRPVSAVSAPDLDAIYGAEARVA
jgi:integrase